MLRNVTNHDFKSKKGVEIKKTEIKVLKFSPLFFHHAFMIFRLKNHRFRR